MSSNIFAIVLNCDTYSVHVCVLSFTFSLQVHYPYFPPQSVGTMQAQLIRMY